ncbi:MAG: ATP-grasp domain-containing protein [Bacilli bacterium]|nr:ATP-grasp domain-containing protein [Bacilli bacterium]
MNFEVVIIGSDANAYYMARCAHEAYGKKVKLISVKPMSFVVHSSIIDAKYDERLWDKEKFPIAMNEYVKEINADKIVCISSNETYARYLVANADKLDKRIVYNYVDLEFLDSLMMKDKFYETYRNSGLLPKTIIYNLDDELNIDFDFPVIIKPSNVITFNHIDFEGKKKIYKLNNIEEVNETINYFKNSDYNDTLIIQEFIPGDDSSLFDGVIYSNSKGKCEFFALAQIGLQEHTSNMVGNAACLINNFNTNNDDNKEIINTFKNFMEKINFKGLAELDIKYDYRDKKYKILEINARQGRCSYYVSAAGFNLVKCVVDDLVFNKENDFKIVDKEIGLTYVPKGIIKKYVKNETFKKEILKLYKEKKVVYPLSYKKDMPLKRKIFLLRKHFRYYKDYKNSYWKN